MPFLPIQATSFKLHEQKHDSEFAEIINCENAGYAKPFNGFWEMLKGPTIEGQVERTIAWHREDPSSRWVYVRDETTGQVVGAMEWNIHKENPYAEEVLEMIADWWLEGTPMRKISDHVLKQFLKGRPHFMGKPHVLISYCVVRPGYRHKGVGSLMMDWGLKLSDKLKLPAFVESTEDGENFYKKHGFELLDELHLDAQITDQGQEFEEVRASLLPMRGLVMTRPLGGKKAAGNGVKESNSVKAPKEAEEVKQVISNASFSEYQFLNCSFSDCSFSNCSIANGRILIENNSLPTSEMPPTSGHSTNGNDQLAGGISH